MSPADLTTRITKEARIFEDAIVREQIFKLYSSRLVVEAEQQKLEERLKEIEKLESKKLRRIFGLMSIWYST